MLIALYRGLATADPLNYSFSDPKSGIQVIATMDYRRWTIDYFNIVDKMVKRDKILIHKSGT